jgi:hypothetical protein
MGMLAGVAARANTSPSDIDPRVTKISAFDYDGVRLHDSRWNDQYLHARQFYFNVSNDDILQGFRAKAGLSAPGKPLGRMVRRGQLHRLRPVVERNVAHVSRHRRPGNAR